MPNPKLERQQLNNVRSKNVEHIPNTQPNHQAIDDQFAYSAGGLRWNYPTIKDKIEVLSSQCVNSY